ncbi:unnamed protein product, partial [Mycena citricolor]
SLLTVQGLNLLYSPRSPRGSLHRSSAEIPVNWGIQKIVPFRMLLIIFTFFRISSSRWSSASPRNVSLRG